MTSDVRAAGTTSAPDWSSLGSVADPRQLFTPEAAAALADLRAAMWTVADPTLIELARLRIAMLLGNDDELTARPNGELVADERVRVLGQWPTSELFSEVERAALAVAEQFVIDVSSISDEQIAQLSEFLPPAQLYGFVSALFVLDLGQRTDIAVRLLFGPAGGR